MKHKVRVLPKEEILNNRCNKYEFINFDEIAMKDKINKLIRDLVHYEQEIAEYMSLQIHLDFYALDIVELVMNLEREFNIQISDEECENIKTVGDVYKTVSSKSLLAANKTQNNAIEEMREFTNKYEGTDKYNDVMLAIEFGMQLNEKYYGKE